MFSEKGRLIRMKAIVCTRYGPPEVLKIMEVEKPLPKKGEVLIRVRAASVAPPDCLLRRGGDARFGLLVRLMLGWKKPRRDILGTDLSGVIEALGKGVERFKVGDEVYGFAAFRLGAYAEYACLPEAASLAVKPANLSHEEAASAVDSASTAYFFLIERGRLRRGEKILINGASGGIGAYAVQLAERFGAEVTGVCSGRNAEAVRGLGAGKVVDYGKEDFTRMGETYDLIFDAAGRSSFSRCKASLRPRGRYLTTEMSLGAILRSAWTALIGGKRAIFALSIDKREALGKLKGLLEAGILRPRIDSVYPIEGAVEAHRRVEQGGLRGKVVIAL
jgi:NADPH:quinone reductase-like Zn-dependent oxidoreductase